MIASRPLNIWRLWITAFWLVVQLAMPFAHAATLKGASAEQIVICTAHGLQLVTLDDTGEGGQPAPASAIPDCPWCHTVCAGALTPEQAAVAWQPTPHRIARLRAAPGPHGTASSPHGFRSRAPPA